MRMNAVETALMNNPVRAAIQRHYEARILHRLGGPVPGGRVLEIGCGRGVGTDVILRRFGVATVDAIDLDPHMIELARRRLSRFGHRVRLDVGDAEHLAAEASSYDAVFDFGIIHHIPDWQAAVIEVHRVLRPGGRFYFEEVTRHALERWSYRTFLDHPRDNRFSADEFVHHLETLGLAVGSSHVQRFFGDFVIGVARKKGNTDG